MQRLLTFFLSLVVFTATVSPLFARQESHTQASLLSEVAAMESGQPFDVALRLVMEPGWHTYWKNPGDSGLATTIKWTLPPGFRAGEIQWPTPHLISTPPLMSYGYENEVVLLVTIHPPGDMKPGANVELSAAVEWLECQEICLPGAAKLKLTLPVAKKAVAASSLETLKIFSDARGLRPLAPSQAEEIVSGVTASGDEKLLRLIVTGKHPWPAGTKAYFFVDQTEVVDSAAPQKVVLKPGENHFELELTRPASAPKVSKVMGVLTVNGVAVNVFAPVSKRILKPTVSTASGASLILPVSLLFAFLGGLILNLMPCVLPVLSLKVLNLVKQSGQDPRGSWKQGVAFTAGVVISFWVLAGLLLGLRAAGNELGWGFQMQSPVFIFFLIALFFIFALNLFGLFEVGTSLVGVDSGAAQHGGMAGSFSMGALATIAATPCTAPFMGAALGFAVAQSTVTAVLVFTFLALGMASPYLVLALFPSLLRFVPKPGAWMESFKQFLGFLLIGTVIYLLWVFGQQLNLDALAGVMGALLVIALGAWIFGRWVTFSYSPRTRGAAAIVALLVTLVGFSWGIRISKALPELGGLTWERYSATRLATLRAEGKPVFLDFTAAWCLSCKVNEAVALNNDAVKQKLISSGIVLMKADWTKRDPEITKALAEFDRNGVPLYVLYGRESGAEPRLLPEVLTPGIVLEALDNLK